LYTIYIFWELSLQISYNILAINIIIKENV